VKRWVVQDSYTFHDGTLSYMDLSEHWFRWSARSYARTLCRFLRPRDGRFVIVVADRKREYKNERIGVQ
jgi:hypothetical protein